MFNDVVEGLGVGLRKGVVGSSFGFVEGCCIEIVGSEDGM